DRAVNPRAQLSVAGLATSISVTSVRVAGSKASPIRVYRSTRWRTTCARPNASLSTFVVLPADAEVSAPRTGGSIVEPEVLVTKAVVDAVDHHGHPFYLRVTAGRLPWVKDDRTGTVLGEPPFDLPDQLLAFFRVGLR